MSQFAKIFRRAYLFNDSTSKLELLNANAAQNLRFKTYKVFN